MKWSTVRNVKDEFYDWNPPSPSSSQHKQGERRCSFIKPQLKLCGVSSDEVFRIESGFHKEVITF